MKRQTAILLIAMSAGIASLTSSFDVNAQSEAAALSAISVMPLASVVVGSSAASTVVALPVVLSTAGAVLVVKAVEVTARSTVYLLERASDGASASVELISDGVALASIAVGTVVTVSVVGAGVVLSTAGRVLAFIPNALGRALLHNERLTR